MEFCKFCLHVGVLSFGSFHLKSGRVSPYFFNLGTISSGKGMSRLAQLYADVLVQQWACEGVVLFGPAYKGIPLAAATSAALYERHGVDVLYAYNRKEVKDHGEGGRLVGASVVGKRVIIIDDVITAGTAIRESVQLIQEAGGVVEGIIVAMDRQERVSDVDPRSAVQQVCEATGVRVVPLATLSDVIDYLKQQNENAWLASMEQYRALYRAQ
jgi:orotate phosphoribosyltransferase